MSKPLLCNFRSNFLVYVVTMLRIWSGGVSTTVPMSHQKYNFCPTNAVRKCPDVAVKIYCGFTLANVEASSWTVVFGLLVLLSAHKHHHPLDLLTWKSAQIHMTCNDTYSNIYKHIFIYIEMLIIYVSNAHIWTYLWFFQKHQIPTFYSGDWAGYSLEPHSWHGQKERGKKKHLSK